MIPGAVVQPVHGWLLLVQCMPAPMIEGHDLTILCVYLCLFVYSSACESTLMVFEPRTLWLKRISQDNNEMQVLVLKESLKR